MSRSRGLDKRLPGFSGLVWAYARALVTMMLRNIMYQADSNPFSECFRFFSSFPCGGPRRGRHFYTRKERSEVLEKTKKRLQDEIAAIDEMIADLKSREPKQA